MNNFEKFQEDKERAARLQRIWDEVYVRVFSSAVYGTNAFAANRTHAKCAADAAVKGLT